MHVQKIIIWELPNCSYSGIVEDVFEKVGSKDLGSFKFYLDFGNFCLGQKLDFLVKHTQKQCGILTTSRKFLFIVMQCGTSTIIP